MMLLTKRGDGLYSPSYDKDFEISRTVKPGDTVAVKIKDSRNVMFHRKYFALLNLTLNNLPERIAKRVTTIDVLLIEIKLHLGWYDLHVTTKGTEVYIPKSISFQTMSQKKFEEFYDNSLNVIITKYLKLTKEEIETELINFF